MTILLYIIIAMLSFYVGYVMGSSNGYRDGLKDAADVISKTVIMKTETITVDKEGRHKDEA